MDIDNFLKKEDSISIISNPNYQTIPFQNENFHEIEDKEGIITFIDGGNTEIFSSLNFNLSFIRIASCTYDNNKLKEMKKEEHLILITTEVENNTLYYKPSLFTSEFELVKELPRIDAKDSSISNGIIYGEISKVVDITRRLLEIEFSEKVNSKNIILDGNLKSENNLIKEALKNKNIYALSKTNRLFTNNGDALTVYLNKIASKLGKNKWFYYPLITPNENEPNIIVSKLHQSSKHIFKIEFNKEFNPELINILSKNSIDPVFLGYPYGLVMVDKLARVTNNEKEYFKFKYLSKMKNKEELTQYLNTINAHEILDNIL
ncbi:DNA double-strand break repair nuclease NurA [Candidatus Woesearchaeota archaeon]|nr:DNA double-strand break repair nuclease NurA [Candidatus Woesearchaeota archaeon]